LSDSYNSGSDRYQPRHNLDSCQKTDSLEQELCSVINKVRDMESKLQRENKEWHKQGPTPQAHSIETDPVDDD
jgi:hypothetical protein